MERSEQNKILSQAIYHSDSLQILLFLKLGLKHLVPSCQDHIALCYREPWGVTASSVQLAECKAG